MRKKYKSLFQICAGLDHQQIRTSTGIQNIPSFTSLQRYSHARGYTFLIPSPYNLQITCFCLIICPNTFIPKSVFLLLVQYPVFFSDSTFFMNGVHTSFFYYKACLYCEIYKTLHKHFWWEMSLLCPCTRLNITGSSTRFVSSSLN